MAPSRLALLSAFAISATIAHLAHGEASVRLEDPFVPVTSAPDTLRLFTGGHQTSVADIGWLRLVQYLGNDSHASIRWPALEDLANFVTTMDPNYGFAYEATGVVLATVGRIDSSNIVLDRGMKNVPGRWQLPFFLGFNHWSLMGDSKQAAQFVLQASKIQGSPRYLPDLATRLFASSGGLDEGIALLETAEGVDSPLMRAEFQRRRTQLLAERAIRAAERGILAFEQAHGHLPSSLSELPPEVTREVEKSIDPRLLTYDAQSGRVGSSLLPGRLKVHIPIQAPEAFVSP